MSVKPDPPFYLNIHFTIGLCGPSSSASLSLIGCKATGTGNKGGLRGGLRNVSISERLHTRNSSHSEGDELPRVFKFTLEKSHFSRYRAVKRDFLRVGGSCLIFGKPELTQPNLQSAKLRMNAVWMQNR